MDSFGYLIPKSGPVADSNMGDLLSVHLEISCPSARNDLSAYLESGVSVHMCGLAVTCHRLLDDPGARPKTGWPGQP